MLDLHDQDILLDLCARNGVDEIAWFLAQPSKPNALGGDRYRRAFEIAHRIMQEPENVVVQIVKPL